MLLLFSHWLQHSCKVTRGVRLMQSIKWLKITRALFLQASLVARIPSRASRALIAASGWPSPGVVSHLSAACSGYPPMTASTRKTIPPPCTATSLRARSKTTWGSARTSARTNPSFRQRRLQDTQVQDLWYYRNFKKTSFVAAVCVIICVNSTSSAQHALVLDKEESIFLLSGFFC